MKPVVQVKLLPTEDQAQALASTLAACNQGASLAAQVAMTRRIRNGWDLRKVTYADVRALGLGSQAAQHAIKKAADAYTTLRTNARNGRYGKPGSPRRNRIMSTPVSFRPEAAQPFDDRCLSWDHTARTVSIWTLQGRMKDIAFVGSEADLAALAQFRKGESDLLCRDGKWLLIATVDEPAAALHEPDAWLGVDLGIAQIAVTSDGQSWSGGAVTLRRKRNRDLRSKLQKKGTKSAKRLLKKRSRKEARFARDANHQISKKIVEKAQRTGYGIALEDLTGIRERVRHRKPQRSTFHSWAFAQLGQFIAYKAERAGVAVTYVDPAHTSQSCSDCGHTDRSNRPSQAVFCCTSCGMSLHADLNAARNISARGSYFWALSTVPSAA